MKKLLLGLLITGSASVAMAQVGDGLDNGNAQIINMNSLLNKQNEILQPNYNVKLVSFSNSKSKIIKPNFSNIDKVYSIVQINIKNGDADKYYSLNMSAVAADNGSVQTGNYYLANSGTYGTRFDNNAIVNSTNFSKLLNKFKQANPTYGFTRLTRITVHVERDGAGESNLIGFVFASSDENLKNNVCTNFYIPADGSSFSSDRAYPENCFDI